MSKVVSYFDWSLGFKESHSTRKRPQTTLRLNSIGIEDTDFKRYLNKWKEENLS